MTEIIQFEDWAKLKLKVGIVKKVGESIVINDGTNDFEIKLDLNVKKGDKIVVGLNGDGLVVPVVNDRIPLDPGQDSKEGSRVS